MTRRERIEIIWFVLAMCFATGLINWGLAKSQLNDVAQPRLKLRGDFDLIELPNGSQWYVRRGSLNAIWGVPRADQERLGTKTKIYGAGFEINAPYEIAEILSQLYEADIAELQELKDQLKEFEHAETDSD